MQKVKKDGIITIEELKDFDMLLAEFNNKLLEIKLKQTKKYYNMISSMSQPGTFNWQETAKAKEAPAVASLVTEKEIKKINKEVQKEIKQEAIIKAKQEIREEVLGAKKSSINIDLDACQRASAEADSVMRLQPLLSLMCCSGNYFSDSKSRLCHATSSQAVSTEADSVLRLAAKASDSKSCLCHATDVNTNAKDLDNLHPPPYNPYY